jgi:hypothetical protein
MNHLFYHQTRFPERKEVTIHSWIPIQRIHRGKILQKMFLKVQLENSPFLWEIPLFSEKFIKDIKKINIELKAACN